MNLSDLLMVRWRPGNTSSVTCLTSLSRYLDPFDSEGYNPESPALTPAGRHPYRHFIPRVQTQRCNLIGLTSSTTSSSLESQASRGKTPPPSPVSHLVTLCLTVHHSSSCQHRHPDRTGGTGQQHEQQQQSFPGRAEQQEERCCGLVR